MVRYLSQCLNLLQIPSKMISTTDGNVLANKQSYKWIQLLRRTIKLKSICNAFLHLTLSMKVSSYICFAQNIKAYTFHDHTHLRRDFWRLRVQLGKNFTTFHCLIFCKSTSIYGINFFYHIPALRDKDWKHWCKWICSSLTGWLIFISILLYSQECYKRYNLNEIRLSWLNCINLLSRIKLGLSEYIKSVMV